MQRAVIIASSRLGQAASANLLVGAGFDVVAATRPDDGIRSVVAGWTPDLALIDLQQNALLLDVLDAVGEASPATAPVVLAHEDDTDRVVSAVQHGARGVLSRHRTSDELTEDLRAVAAGGTVVDPQMAAPLTQHVTRGVRRTGPYGLTRSEELIVSHLPRELTNDQIGRRVGVTTSTVKTHLRNAFRKLGVRDRVEAALFAVERGLA